MEEEADFGDVVEIALKPSLDYCARHQDNRVIISTRENNNVEYQERAILYLVGYYGGMRKGDFKESLGLSEKEVAPVFIYNPGETVVCLDPTLHRKDAVDALKFQGDGLFNIPISAISSYNILSKSRRGFRVMN